jgi:hypothetical protein
MDNGHLAFSKMSHRKWTWDLGEPFATELSGIEVWEGDVGGGSILWAIDATNSSMLHTIPYGVVPDGYAQRWPVQGAPRPLRGGVYGLNCGAGLGQFKLENGVVKNLIDAEASNPPLEPTPNDGAAQRPR